jgi:hypothetical protein
LADADVERLPANIFADPYTDLRVRVLNYEKVIQARPFAGGPSATSAAHRDAFARIVTALRTLHERAIGK